MQVIESRVNTGRAVISVKDTEKNQLWIYLETRSSIFQLRTNVLTYAYHYEKEKGVTEWFHLMGYL